MVSPEIAILDVGHGASAALVDAEGVVVIDTAPGETLLEFLERRGITRIDAVLISHADEDHLGGVIQLLTDPDKHVGVVYLNPDPLRDTDIWHDFRVTIDSEPVKQRTRVCVGLTEATSELLRRQDVEIRVLAPSAANAAASVGGRDMRGRRQTANSLSAVVALGVGGPWEVLFAGDIDHAGLENLLAGGHPLQARILVFPHHGGRTAGGSMEAFARRLCEEVQPEVVVFTIGRGIHNTPRPEVVTAVKSAVPAAHIACTQLSLHCASSLPSEHPAHLTVEPARGKPSRRCCAGTIVIQLGQDSLACQPLLDEHLAFIATSAPTALCRRTGSEDVSRLEEQRS